MNITDSSTTPVAVIPVEHDARAAVAVGESTTSDAASEFVCGRTRTGTYSIAFRINYNSATWDHGSYRRNGQAKCNPKVTATTTVTKGTSVASGGTSRSNCVAFSIACAIEKAGCL